MNNTEATAAVVLSVPFFILMLVYANILRKWYHKRFQVTYFNGFMGVIKEWLTFLMLGGFLASFTFGGIISLFNIKF